MISTLVRVARQHRRTEVKTKPCALGQPHWRSLIYFYFYTRSRFRSPCQGQTLALRTDSNERRDIGEHVICHTVHSTSTGSLCAYTLSTVPAHTIIFRTVLNDEFTVFIFHCVAYKTKNEGWRVVNMMSWEVSGKTEARH
jgi:hypothetical protein